MNLLQRSEIFCYIYDIYTSEKQTICIEARVNDKFKKDFVFAVGSKRQEATLKQKFYELVCFFSNFQEKVCKKPNSVFAKYPDNLCVLTESNDIYDAIIDSEMLSLLSKHQLQLEYFICTDFPVEVPDSTEQVKYNHRIQMQFKLDNLNLSNFAEFLDSFFAVFSKFHSKDSISADGKALIAKNRANFKDSILKEEYKRKAEETMKKKLDDKKKEASLVSSLSPEAQRKYDEKEYKKQLKKRMKSKMIKA